MIQINSWRYKGFAICAGLAIGVILVITKNYGVGVSPDSVGYISTARHIISGQGFVSYDGTPYLVQPPLYPFLLAFFGFLFNIDPYNVARILNAILFGFIVYLAGLITCACVSKKSIISVAGSIFSLFSIPLLEVSSRAWTESLFILLIILFFVWFQLYLKTTEKKYFILFSFATALTCLTRYIGLALILVGIISIFFFRSGSIRSKVKKMVIYVVISSLPILGWIIRNYYISSTLFGPRAKSSYSFSQNLSFTSEILFSWFIPERLVTLFVVIILLSLSLFIWSKLNSKQTWTSGNKQSTQNHQIVMFVIIYTALLLLSSTTTAYDRINNRLLSPLFVPILFLGLCAIEKIIAYANRGIFRQLPGTLIVICTLSVFLIYPIRATILSYQNIFNIGYGYSNRYWRNSETINFLDTEVLNSEYVIYSNAPDAIYFLSGLNSLMSPRMTMYNSSVMLIELSDLVGIWPKESISYLVWFENVDRSFLFSIDDLQKVANIQLLKNFNDGAIYLVQRQ